MTRKTNARIAGFAYLFYIVVGISNLVLFGKAASGDGLAAKLTSIAQHTTAVRISVVLSLLTCFTALVLGVALYGLTHDEDRELSVLALACRVCEGLLGAVSLRTTLGLLWLATKGAGAPGPAATEAIGASLLMPVQSALVSAMFFAVGSTIFSWLLLRGRMVPVPLAWLGVISSVLLVLTLPLQLAGFLEGSVILYMVMWMPMLVFEVTLALWLIIKGVTVRSPKTYE